MNLFRKIFGDKNSNEKENEIANYIVCFFNREYYRLIMSVYSNFVFKLQIFLCRHNLYLNFLQVFLIFFHYLRLFLIVY